MAPKSPRTLPTAVGLMLFQLFTALFVTGGRLSRLVYWDATWYRDIAERGYSVTLPLTHQAAGGSNIAFFPAFPLWTAIVLRVLPVDSNAAVLIASWIACIGMWAYFVCLLKRLGVRPAWCGIALAAWLVQPGAFYGVAGYSEPLFTAALLGYVHWSTRAITERRWAFAALAVLHGAVLSSTRILGVPCVAYPLLLIFFRAHVAGRFELGPERRRELGFGLPLALLSLSGFLGFLAYCSVRWGQWNLYWEANRVGWNVFFDPWKLLTPSYYTEIFFVGNLSEVLGRLLTVATLLGAIFLLRAFWRRRSEPGPPVLLALATLNLGLMAETIIGSHGMHSMIRYLVPIHALLIPQAVAFAQSRSDRATASNRESPKSPRLGAWATWGLLALWLYAVQIMFVIRYSRNEWVS